MDDRTLDYYKTHAPELVRRYESIGPGVSRYFGVAFPKGARVLDLGAGTGRDAARLARDGYEAWGVEPSDAMREVALETHPDLTGKLKAGALPDGLPDLETLGGPFDGILCSAVLQHLPRPALFDAAFSMKSLLEPHGRALVSIPAARPDVGEDERDPYGRLFTTLSADELQLLFERIGFSTIGRWTDDDAGSRPGVTWTTLLFELADSGVARPLDLIEGVLTRDKKVATYKLALFRALCDIALTQPHRVTWYADWPTKGREGPCVGVPVDAVAERWIVYYWSLFRSPVFLPQMNGERAAGAHTLGFARPLEALMEAYGQAGDLTRFVLDRRSGAFPPGVEPLYQELLPKLRRAITSGPVTYAGGSLDARLFGHARGQILVAPDLWRELSLMGHWVQEALVLRWAELVARLSKGEVAVETAVARLLLPDLDPAREQADARAIYAPLPDKTCVWTGERLSHRFDVDHVLPYSLWRNNDLWNLLPAARAVNGKKRDKLPTRRLLRARRPAIEHYWEVARAERPQRFQAEVRALTGQDDPVFEEVFRVLLESVEVTALQRGAERWEP